jgi:hypothetical protein
MIIFIVDKFLITDYDRDDLVVMAKEAFKDELKEILVQQEKDKEFDLFLTNQEVGELLKISLANYECNRKNKEFCFGALHN